MSIRVSGFWLVLASAPLLAVAATPKDYAHGLAIAPSGGQPVQEIVLDDAVYAGVTRANLADLRVFNAAGAPVPQALCAPESQTLAQVHERALAVIPLTTAATADTRETKIQIETSGAVSLDVEPTAPSESPAPSARISAYVLDVGAANADGVLRALSLDWQSADGASELPVRVSSSEDLERWQIQVAQTMLVRAATATASLNLSRIALPRQATHRYLRIERADLGAGLELLGVRGEFVQYPPLPAPRSFRARLLADDAREPASYFFDAAHLAPTIRARVLLPEPNMALSVALDSRGTALAPWQTQWSGEVFEIASDTGSARAPEIRFAANSDRWWRLRVLRGQDTLAGARPGLDLGYRPHRVRFLAQGAAPFLLAYGSARELQPVPLGCDSFLSGMDPAARKAMTAETTVGETAHVSQLGGAQALQAPPPPPRPLRQFVLWAVLALGAAAVAVMALQLLRRLRPDGEP